MTHKYTQISVTLLLVIIGGATAVLAHPVDDYEARSLPACYGSDDYTFPGAEHSYNDITFVEHYPDPDMLSNAERYMLNGTIDGPPELCRPGDGLQCWKDFVLRTARQYFKRFGKFPDTLTPEVYAAAHSKRPSEIDPIIKQLICNPITGEYAKLNSQEFAPGDMYLKALDPAEMAYFASLDEADYELWYNKRVKRKDDSWREVQFEGPVVYVRMYGRQDVIFNSLDYVFIVHNDKD